MSYAPKSWSQRSAVDPEGNAVICFEPVDLIAFKTVCDTDKARADMAELALNKYLNEPPVADIAFYQEKPVVVALAILAAVATAVAVKK